MDLTKNADPQTLHENVSSPVCIHTWHFNEGLVEFLDPHISQENAFSPMCVSMRTFRW